ncbi:replication initiator protein A (plasmid) [Deinococcus sp. KNUC1210]|uniref:replication initiator protein A n=1 Tax=Deinococcus sp. KNUC1210 TaxID=2917691 RepID=UPI001EEFAAF1|nr:replication initiator protein A [Deinococcus sp. KNUC1210]ULH14007.1 replication initiator protein A [Deinococcus sp. KNUC1210]
MAKPQLPPPSSSFPKSPSLATYDEANVSRLGLISIQERIPDDYTNWLIEFFREGRPSRLQCVASAEYGGVPHGLDGDIATALTDLFIEQGAPEDGKIRTTAYALLKRAGFSDAGHYYVALKRSLHRLRFAGYSASECWRDAVRERWVTVTFTYLTGLTFSADEAQLHLNRGSELEVTLAEPIVRSIRASYLKPLDYTFLRSLDRPLTRSLFRLLDARRYDPLSLSDPLPVLRVGLIEWARDCKIANLSPDKIRRTLQGAHEELLQRNYLLSVDYEGKGSKQVVTYHFQTLSPTDQADPPLRIDNAALQGMIDRRISRPVAVRLLTQFGEDHILSRLSRGDQILAGGFQPKSSGAFLVDIIKDTAGKYDDASGQEAEAAAKRATTQARVARTAALDEQQIQQHADLSQATPQERAAAALPVLKLVLGKRLSSAEYGALQAYLLLPSADAGKLSRDALAAKVNGSVDQFLAALQKVLHSP